MKNPVLEIKSKYYSTGTATNYFRSEYLRLNASLVELQSIALVVVIFIVEGYSSGIATNYSRSEYLRLSVPLVESQSIVIVVVIFIVEGSCSGTVTLP
ncbi:hypothetical protein AB4140_07825 [Shewanella sp. 10N.286.51.B2]|uniref:hypothetical protein n=1 Tax=Shewanella sp. 10N.286.51.B2 TaxID=3229707 RepID=UPI0035530362